MANATAAQVYTAVKAIETTTKSENLDFILSVSKQAVYDKVIADNAGVSTEAEVLAGLELACGKAAGTTADEYKLGDYKTNRTTDTVKTPATNVLFMSPNGLFVTTLS